MPLVNMSEGISLKEIGIDVDDSIEAGTRYYKDGEEIGEKEAEEEYVMEMERETTPIRRRRKYPTDMIEKLTGGRMDYLDAITVISIIAVFYSGNKYIPYEALSNLMPEKSSPSGKYVVILTVCIAIVYVTQVSMRN
jgi:hypothetical protein